MGTDASPTVVREDLAGRRGFPSLKLSALARVDPSDVSSVGDDVAMPRVEYIHSPHNEKWKIAEVFGYELGDKLGCGSMSAVRRATRKNDQQIVALKCIKSSDHELRATARAEFELLRTLSHPAIVCAYNMYETSRQMVLCLEWCSDGCVETYVDRHGPFTNAFARSLLHQFIQGVDYIHRKRVVHRDLKPANLLLHGGAAMLKITDFNSAKQIGDGNIKGGLTMLTDRGTHQFKPPEIRLGLMWNERVDIWSYGLCVFFMLEGTYPFDATNRQIERYWASGCNPEICWGGITSAVQNLIMQCLTLNVHDRPAAMELVMHPAFQDHIGREGARDGMELFSTPSSQTVVSATRLVPSCGLLSLSVGSRAHGHHEDVDSKLSYGVSIDFVAESAECRFEAEALKYLVNRRWKRIETIRQKSRPSPIHPGCALGMQRLQEGDLKTPL